MTLLSKTSYNEKCKCNDCWRITYGEVKPKSKDVKHKEPKDESHLCFHPAGHLRGKELEDFKKEMKLFKAMRDVAGILKVAGYKIAFVSGKGKDKLFKIREIK